jgi:hypothetical protein
MHFFGKARDESVIFVWLQLFAAAEVVVMWCPCYLCSPPPLARTPSVPLPLCSCCSAMDDKDFVEQVQKISWCVAHSCEVWLM